MTPRRPLWSAALTASALTAGAPLMAQTFSVNTITTSRPSFGNIAAAASGTTVFRISPAGAITVASGNGGNTPSGTKGAATITIRCVGAATCASATALVKIWPTTTVSGRAGAVTNLAVASGSGTVGTVITNGDGSIQFPLTGFSGTSNRTFTLGLDLPILGDTSSTSTSAAARWRVGVAKSPTVPTTFSSQTNAIATVRKALTLTKTSDLAFGAIRAPDAGSGSVTINASTGVRSIAGGTPVLIGGMSSSRAQFTVGGQGSTAFSISVPSSFSLTRSGGGSLTSTLTPTATGAQTLSTGGAFSLGVGGTLTVPSGSAGGDYSGTFTVTVSYN